MSVPRLHFGCRERRERWTWCAVALLSLSLIAPIALGRHEIERSPYLALVEHLLEALHAVEVPCELALDHTTLCFEIVPGTVAAVAEGLEHSIDEYGGVLLRSDWRSANGVHHVELRFSDDLWGALEMWLTEPNGQLVAGRLMYLPKRRNGAP